MGELQMPEMGTAQENQEKTKSMEEYVDDYVERFKQWSHPEDPENFNEQDFRETLQSICNDLKNSARYVETSVEEREEGEELDFVNYKGYTAKDYIDLAERVNEAGEYLIAGVKAELAIRDQLSEQREDKEKKI